MSVKRYKLYLEIPTGLKDKKGHDIKKRISTVRFDENDGKGYEDKAHLSTIDKFTTQFIEPDHLLYELNKYKIGYPHLNCICCEIDILSSDLVIIHNQNKEESYDYLLYEDYKTIADMPLINLAYCDTKSVEFEKFINSFLTHLYDDFFYYDLLKSHYYSDYFKDYAIGYREYGQFNRSKALMIEQLKGYAMMRKAYKDILDHDKCR